MILPGFYTPAPIKEQERLFTSANGTFEVVLQRSVETAVVMPRFGIHLTQSAGQDILPMWDNNTNQYVFDEIRPGEGRCFVLRVRASDLSVWPGTYQLTVTQNGSELFTRPLTVKPRPSVPPS